MAISTTNALSSKPSTPSKTSIDTSAASSPDPTLEFAGDVNTNNEIPTRATLARIDNLNVLDKDGKAIPFRDLYNGPNVARRVLIIFIRHFFCGNCQEYIRTLTASITPSSLLHLPTPTAIAIIGCGSPSLIPMYAEETSCAFPVYADPTKKLYDELGMLRTLNLGARPDYMRKSLISAIAGSVVQSLKMMKGGRVWKGGDMQQVGGEFLFEPVEKATPICSPDVDAGEKRLGEGETGVNGYLGGTGFVEAKRVVWCHRMRNTRDHAELPEVREVLGLDVEGEEMGGGNKRRWTRALEERKGTGLVETETEA